MKTDLLNHLQVCDVILLSRRDPLSLVVRSVTYSRFSHCVLYIGSGEYIEASLKGVKIHKVSDIKEPFAVIRYTTLSRNDKRRILRYAKDKLDCKYDFLGVIGIGYDILFQQQENPWDRKDAYWCSELIADSFIASNVCIEDIEDRRTWRVSPQDLYDSISFTTIKE